MALYRAILTLAAPAILIAMLLRVLRRTETFRDLRQRLGGGPGGAPGALWLHGASNGELTSARALAEALRSAFPDRALVITSNTVSGRALAAGWGLEGADARLAPLDFRWALARFRRGWRPAALIVLENEFWPNRLETAGEPVLFLGARMSEKSYRLWLRFPRLAYRLLGRVSRLSPQDAASAARFRDLGLPEDRLGPTVTLKSAVALAAADPDELAAFRKVFPRAETLLAASTHEGEEAMVLDAFAKARSVRPGLKLILAPRHPRRASDIAQMIADAGLPWARRSDGGMPPPETVVYLADTLGEMPLWYALAGVTFVGGSLVPRGGHTPFEPAQAGSAILHGPHISNFTEAYGALARDGGAIAVTNADDLKAALLNLASEAAQAAAAHRAAAALAAGPDAGAAVDDLIAALQTLLDPRHTDDAA